MIARTGMKTGIVRFIRKSGFLFAFLFYHLSRVYALGGKRKDALGALKNAVARGFNDMTELAGNPDFEELRNDPAFLQLLRTIEK